MNFASLCSGIEAASVAWRRLGWRARFVSEVAPFPCAVLAHHYPTVPNLGDITEFKGWPDAAIDILVGGTPCQSFSVAGLRKGLDDPRGNLMLVYLAIARRYTPRWLVWENVPGVLSTHGGRDFGTLLGGLAELGYGFAYRILDAQFFGVAQRRRRVFVIAYLGDWRRAAAVLFERQSLLGYPAPRREAGKDTSACASRRAYGGNNTSGGIDIATSCNACASASGRMDFESETFVVEPLPFDTTQITSATNRCSPQYGDPCHPLAASAHAPAIAFDCKASGRNGFGIGEVAPTLRSMGHLDSHQNGGGHQAVMYESTVRRLTPRECERLQGFPDDYTRIIVRGKVAADGPRYKALGNSMAVPVMAWIGNRIQMADEL
ncbi:DNA cytosine methyltransferase [Burkholderia pseudomallei]|nr:DNA cytosine methyltransferase [Burkholderia pseudomallei]